MTITHLEQVLQRRAKEINNHNIVITLSPRPHDPWYSGAAHESLVDF